MLPAIDRRLVTRALYKLGSPLASRHQCDTTYVGMLTALLQWHAQDPVDDVERNRNPFIDHPEWVACLFMDECDAGCPQDFDGDGSVDAFDLAQVLGSWGPCEGCPADFNGDNIVNASDLAQVLGAWGLCP